MKEIDARGLACPVPVLQTRAVLQEENPGRVRVIVDNAAAQQNVQRFLSSQGFQAVLEGVGEDRAVVGTGRETCAEHPTATVAPGPESDTKKIMVMCTTDRMGYGDDGLGSKLMVNFRECLYAVQSGAVGTEPSGFPDNGGLLFTPQLHKKDGKKAKSPCQHGINGVSETLARNKPTVNLRIGSIVCHLFSPSRKPLGLQILRWQPFAVKYYAGVRLPPWLWSPKDFCNNGVYSGRHR